MRENGKELASTDSPKKKRKFETSQRKREFETSDRTEAILRNAKREMTSRDCSLNSSPNSVPNSAPNSAPNSSPNSSPNSYPNSYPNAFPDDETILIGEKLIGEENTNFLASSLPSMPPLKFRPPLQGSPLRGPKFTGPKLTIQQSKRIQQSKSPKMPLQEAEAQPPALNQRDLKCSF